MDLARLSSPFPAAEIEWRVGSTNSEKSQGLALAYLTARHVMERLDDVCGAANWQDRYEFHGSRTICYLSIKIGDDWVTKADGAGDSDVEAEKGAISDALKRAAVKWGIGRYLYSLGNTWVAIEPAGRSVRIKREEYPKLEAALVRQFGTATHAPSGPVKQISSFRAKQLFKTDVLLGEIDGAANEKRLDELSALFGGELAFLPDPWLSKFQERISQRRDELNGVVIEDERGPIETDPNTTLDRQFAETVG